MTSTVLAISEPHEPITGTAKGPGYALAEQVVTDVSEPEAQAEPVVQVETVAAEPAMTYAGNFLLTAYCNCRICCGRWSGGPTASGTMPQEGRTIAVDKRVIPLGTHVYIEGLGEFIAEDTGSAVKGNRIDVYMGSHTAAKWFAGGAGSCRRNVWIVADK